MLFPVIVLIQHFHLEHRHLRWWTALSVNGAVLACYLAYVLPFWLAAMTAFFADTDALATL